MLFDQAAPGGSCGFWGVYMTPKATRVTVGGSSLL